MQAFGSLLMARQNRCSALLGERGIARGSVIIHGQKGSLLQFAFRM